MKIKVCFPKGAIFIDLKLAEHAIVIRNWESHYLWIFLLSLVIKNNPHIITNILCFGRNTLANISERSC